MLPLSDLDGSTISGNVEMLNGDPARELPVAELARIPYENPTSKSTVRLGNQY